MLMDLGWEGKGFLSDSSNFTGERENVTFEGGRRGHGVVGEGLRIIENQVQEMGRSKGGSTVRITGPSARTELWLNAGCCSW